MSAPQGSADDRAADEVTSVLLSGGTYRTLAEQVLSPAEESFERRRRTVGFLLAPLVTVVVLVLPLELTRAQHSLAAVLLGVVVLWVCEPLPIPISGLLGVAVIVLLGVVPVDDAFAPFGSSTVFVFIGAFILAQAMLRHGLARRFALRILSLPGVGRSSTRVIVAFGVITCLLSSVVSNTATVAMLLPTAVGLLSVMAGLVRAQVPAGQDVDPLRLRVGVALMLMLAYAASVGGLLTPIGSPPNLIGRALIEEATGRNISFFAWVATAAPLCLAMFAVLAVVLSALNRPELRELTGVEGLRRRAASGTGAAVTRGAQHADRLQRHGDAVGAARRRRPGGGRRVGRLRRHQRPAGRRGRRGAGCRAAVRAAHQLAPPRVHPDLDRGRPYRLGHGGAVRHRNHLRHAAARDRAGRDARLRRRRRSRSDQHGRADRVRGGAGDPGLGGHVEHGVGGGGGPGGHPAGDGGPASTR